ncbi:DUF1127 domain-containing protein [Pseudomonas oryzae]|uniref:Uncharacterized conserved protein YjiS, DUF1127 family n=1 Tax=Pseudomonas oryzae TaxID=1392877 RepID=A0A1H1NCI5_9PSED|nr:DUF1127 domain-containing protein [Pseudomonas oryzae]SDR96079.1 Uncharacterized conserved protein YjiS, DUF1127 family [Pseudomonas oryzae]
MKGQVKWVGSDWQRVGDARPAWWRRVWQRIVRWRQLARQRRQLAMLSDVALKDIGLSRADIWEETQRPFWDDDR